MPDSHNIDPLLIVKDRINDAVIPLADAPRILFTNQFAGTRRTWLHGQCLDLGDDPVDQQPAQRLQFLAGGTRQRDGYSATQFAMPA